MNTSEENIYNKEILDSKFLIENRIKKISTYSYNDKRKEILSSEKFLNPNGTIHKLIRGENGWQAYPPNQEITHSLDYIEEYTYENGNLILIEENQKLGAVNAKHEFTYLPEAIKKKSFAINKLGNFEISQVAYEKFNSNGKLIEVKIERPKAYLSGLVSYNYPAKDKIIKTVKQTIIVGKKLEEANLFETKFLFNLDSLGRLKESIWEIDIEGFTEKSNSVFRYISKDSSKLSLIQTYENNEIVSESKFSYGRRKELISFKIINPEREFEIKYDYQGGK